MCVPTHGLLSFPYTPSVVSSTDVALRLSHKQGLRTTVGRKPCKRFQICFFVTLVILLIASYPLRVERTAINAQAEDNAAAAACCRDRSPNVLAGIKASGHCPGTSLPAPQGPPQLGTARRRGAGVLLPWLPP